MWSQLARQLAGHGVGTWCSVGAQTNHVLCRHGGLEARECDFSGPSVLDFCQSRLLLNLSLSNLMSYSIDPPPLSNYELRKWSSAINDSEAYGNLAMELIFLCRFCVQAHDEGLDSSIQLRR